MELDQQTGHLYDIDENDQFYTILSSSELYELISKYERSDMFQTTTRITNLL